MTGISDLIGLTTAQQRRGQRECLAVCKRPAKPRRFVVLSYQRSGSNLLCGYLFNHPQITMHNELFNPVQPLTYRSGLLGPYVHWERRNRSPATFLKHIWESSARPEDIVGFKSFPEHWIEHPEVFRALLEDTDIAKVVLRRENPVACLVSQHRARSTGMYLTESYDDCTVHLTPAEVQDFILKQNKLFGVTYQSALGPKFELTYEELIACPEQVFGQLCGFLGVDPCVTPKALPETVPQSHDTLDQAIENYAELWDAFRYSADAIHFSHVPSPLQTACAHSNTKSETHAGRWNVLLPICGRNQAPEECWAGLEAFAKSLAKTTDSKDQIVLSVGIDRDDPVYWGSEDRIEKMLRRPVKFVVFEKELAGQVCRMWNKLAAAQEADYYVLLGDDIVLETPGWPVDIATKFHELATERGLPLGVACVAFDDLSFPRYPTFPVLHHRHIETHGTMLPRAFVNQGGDPYLFEIYRRWGTSTFATSRLRNTIGGASPEEAATTKEPRYGRHPIRWSDYLLSGAVARVADCAAAEGIAKVARPLVCIDVVVPTYRCDVGALRRIVALSCDDGDAALGFHIVVDRPEHPDVPEILRLERPACGLGTPAVKVTVVHRNVGASEARNIGLFSSSADWVLFLDDDVVPNNDVIRAYARAIRRHPEALILVGTTNLPPPTNIWTRGVVTSGVTSFYDIARRSPLPPWGVTANLCVRARTETRRFDPIYPRTGGGEDVAFCMLSRSNGSICSVPEAVVDHPWWNDGASCYGQIMGWAQGDSLCLRTLRFKTFLSPPNWVEVIVFVTIAVAVVHVLTTVSAVHQTCVTTGPVSILLVPVCIGVELFVKICTLWTHAVSSDFIGRTQEAAVAASIHLCQEATRTLCILARGHIDCLMRRMDWYDGQRPQYVYKQQLEATYRLALFVLVSWLLMGR